MVNLVFFKTLLETTVINIILHTQTGIPLTVEKGQISVAVGMHVSRYE